MLKTNNKIENYKIYKCGYCINDLSKVYKKIESKKEKFYATSVLFKHKEKGYFLFDTGYSQKIYAKGGNLLLYRFLNKTVCNKDDEIKSQLLRDGIGVDDINEVIISHLHPDHIGGLGFFRNSKFVISKEAYKKYLNNKMSYLIFKQLIPEHFEENKFVLKDTAISNLNNYFAEVYDYFGDESMLLVKLGGHCNGQLGLYLPEYRIFFISDALWKLSLIDEKLTYIGKLIQEDYVEFEDTIQRIKRFIKKENVQVITCHGDLDE